MKKLLIAIIFGVITIFFVGIIVVKVYLDQAITVPQIDNSTRFSVSKGLSFTPKTYDLTGINDFYAKAKDCCSVVSWVGDIAELENWKTSLDNENSTETTETEGSGAIFVTKTAPANNLLPIPIFVIKTILDSDQSQNYIDLLTQFVSINKLKYIGIGNEINRAFNSEDILKFRDWFNEAYTSIKSLNPQTKVFTVFQFENLEGLNGGLFGGANDESAAQWDLLEEFNKADFFGFTSYPGLIYKNPAEIPENYWSQISDHTTKSFALTETGWFKDSAVEGWESSENEEIQYVDRIAQLTNNLKPEFIIWSFLYDLEHPLRPFTTMGLIPRDQSTSKIYDAWRDLFILK